MLILNSDRYVLESHIHTVLRWNLTTEKLSCYVSEITSYHKFKFISLHELSIYNYIAVLNI